MKTFFWVGYCNNERIKAVKDIEKLINPYGYIVDFKLFSDISISIKIEIEELQIDSLYDALKTYLSLDNVDKVNSSSKVERVIFLNITFTKGTGNLRVETPAVPG